MTSGLGKWSERLAVLASSAALVVLATVSGGCGNRESAQQAALDVAGSENNAARHSPLSPVRVARLENSLRAIEDGLRESPRDRWDPAYVVEQVGTDPQRLFDWVRDNTYWIPYRGLLRGPVGVLNDRLGSSLDRAVLLATLLQKAGHSVRVAHRQLAPEDGFELALAAALGSRPADESLEVAEPELDDAETPGAQTPTIAAEYNLDPEQVERTLADRAQTIESMITGLDARVGDQTQRLLAALDDTPASEEWIRRFEAAMLAVRDHWWVQRQDGEKWIDLDVLASNLSRNDATPPEAFSLEELAPQHHELALRVIIERWSGGKTTERRAMEHTWRPSETLGQPIVLQFWPADWRTDEVPATNDPEQAFRAMALDQQGPRDVDP